MSKQSSPSLPATTSANIAHLMRTDSSIKTEQDAKLLLNKLQRLHPQESIHITESGTIFSKSENGYLTQLGKDGQPIMSGSSEHAKDLYAHYRDQASKEDVSIDESRERALRRKSQSAPP